MIKSLSITKIRTLLLKYTNNIKILKEINKLNETEVTIFMVSGK